MKRNENNQPKSRKYLKRKLMAALCMLLISSILMATTSYAWLVLSTAPEVTGITTNIGANGSLEIALLNTETRKDMTKIRSGVGDSLSASRVAAANNTWGNLIDLSFQDYGLDNILLLPARLDATKAGSGYTVNSGMLAVPTYGYDGRIVELDYSSDSAIFDITTQRFSFIPGGDSDYGVRAIGTSDALSAQAAALAKAQSNIKAYTNSAISATKASLSSNGEDIFGMLMTQMTTSNPTYGNNELDLLLGMLTGLEEPLTSIDLALRQGLVAVAASEIDGEDLFIQVRDQIVDTSKPIRQILTELAISDKLPAAFDTWLTELEDTQGHLGAAVNACAALKTNTELNGVYTWEHIRSVLNYIMNTDSVLIGDTPFNSFNKDSAMSLLGSEIKLTLKPGSGIYADIADFTGNYSANMTVAGTAVTIQTMSAANYYLPALSAAVADLEPADSSTVATAADLDNTFGYVLDLAFRCNAPNPDLLLQTIPEQRVYDGSTSPSTMGGGSYMEFSTRDAAFPLDKMIALMDAVRVGFVDMQGNLLGVGKLNTSNRTILDGTVKASLYLYDYTIEPKGEKDGKLGAMIMGERRKTDNKIMDLTQNTAAALSVVVWLDGDIVDNTMVSATESASLNGMLNLQFATSADLVPAGNAVLLNMEPNKDNLATLLEQNKETFEANQGQYTTASWKEFVSAYTYADSVNESLDSNEFQIYHAMTDLALAQNGLTTVTHDALATQIGAVRELVGINSGVTARYVLEDATGAYYTVDPYTEEQKANKVGEIEEVNPAKNLRDEGHDITSPIYTNESWNALAAALYHAEATHMNANATDQQISSALDALDAAYKALEHRVFFIPYEYNGRIYYTAIRNRDAVLEANDVDTYGTWYYADFTRVVSDLTTLELDAYAEPAEIATIQQSEFVDYRTLLINPYVTIKDDFYPELKDEEFLAIQWNPAPDLFTQGVTASQLAQLSYLCEKGTELGVTSQAADDFATAAKVLNPGVDDPEYLYTESEAATLIRNLAPIVNAAVAAKEQEDADAKAEAEKDNITADQRTVLTAAIASAKTVVGYENAENTDEKLVALRAAVTAAQALLDNAAATKDTADEALTELNKQLVANGKTEVTAYNTITYKIPLTSEEYEVAYGVNHPNTRLLVHGEIGTRELKAIVLTKNGVVFTVSKEITVYHPALDIESYSMVEDAQGKANKATSATLNVGEEAELLYEFELYTATEKDGKYYNQRDILLTETILDASLNHCIPHGETVGATRYSEYRWASSDPKVVSITSDDTSDICTISAVGAGSATISLSVITDQGNMYYDTFSITVTSTTPETP